MPGAALPTIHATAVAIGRQGVLLLGPPGCGKSDLALRLIDRGAVLVADDRVHVAADGTLHPPPAISGLIEVRGLGILPMPHVAGVRAVLAVDLAGDPHDAAQRLPEPAVRTIGGLVLPVIVLGAFEASAPLKVELAVAHGASKG